MAKYIKSRHVTGVDYVIISGDTYKRTGNYLPVSSTTTVPIADVKKMYVSTCSAADRGEYILPNSGTLSVDVSAGEFQMKFEGSAPGDNGILILQDTGSTCNVQLSVNAANNLVWDTGSTGTPNNYEFTSYPTTLNYTDCNNNVFDISLAGLGSFILTAKPGSGAGAASPGSKTCANPALDELQFAHGGGSSGQTDIMVPANWCQPVNLPTASNKFDLRFTWNTADLVANPWQAHVADWPRDGDNITFYISGGMAETVKVSTNSGAGNPVYVDISGQYCVNNDFVTTPQGGSGDYNHVWCIQDTWGGGLLLKYWTDSATDGTAGHATHTMYVADSSTVPLPAGRTYVNALCGQHMNSIVLNGVCHYLIDYMPYDPTKPNYYGPIAQGNC
jgi:hypothetical protein